MLKNDAENQASESINGSLPNKVTPNAEDHDSQPKEPPTLTTTTSTYSPPRSNTNSRTSSTSSKSDNDGGLQFRLEMEQLSIEEEKITKELERLKVTKEEIQKQAAEQIVDAPNMFKPTVTLITSSEVVIKQKEEDLYQRIQEIQMRKGRTYPPYSQGTGVLYTPSRNLRKSFKAHFNNGEGLPPIAPVATSSSSTGQNTATQTSPIAIKQDIATPSNNIEATKTETINSRGPSQ